MLSIVLSIVFSSGFFSIPSAEAYLTNSRMPVCLDGPDEMQIDNQRVLDMKRNTKNQYRDRGFISGTVTKTPNIKNDHDHFVVSIGPGPGDTIEIVYNNTFGAMMDIREGDPIVVCGDYITSNARGGGYDASPEGALIHWVHFNPGSRDSSRGHEHGYLMVGTNLIGFDEAPEGAWNGRIIRTSEPSGHGPESRESPVPADTSSDRQQRGNSRPRGAYSGPCRTFDECRARNAG